MIVAMRRTLLFLLIICMKVGGLTTGFVLPTRVATSGQFSNGDNALQCDNEQFAQVIDFMCC